MLASLQRRLDEAEDDEMRAKFEAYQSFRTCPDCGGSRLRPESRAATVAGKTIVEVMAMPVTEALEVFKKFASMATMGSDLSDRRGQTPLVEDHGGLTPYGPAPPLSA